MFFLMFVFNNRRSFLFDNYRCGRSNGVDIDTDVKRELFGLLELVIGRFKKQEIVIKKEPDVSGSFKA